MKNPERSLCCVLFLAAQSFAAAMADDTKSPSPAATPLAETVPVGDTSTEVDASPTQATSHNRVIEEIVVTAQKREERIQDVPISIQAFSGDALEARGVESTNELGPTVPSLQFTTVAGFQLIYIRGIGTDNFIPSADPSIATYVDGIYVPPSQGGTESLGNVQRVEVLKGPQGTLFGRNATGGAISIVTEEPGSVLKGALEGELGNYQDRAAKGNVSGPITDWLSASLAGQYAYRRSVYSNVNQSIEPDRSYGFRGKLNFHPTDKLTLSLTGNYAHQQSASGQVGNNTTPSPLGTALGIQAQPDSYRGNSDALAASAASQRVYYGILNWQLPRFDLKLLGSHEFILTEFASFDFDGSSQPIAAFDVTSEYTRLSSGELQILSNDNTWLHEQFKWVLGLYYYHGLAGVDPARVQAAPNALKSLIAVGDNQLGVPIPSAVQTAADGFLNNLNMLGLSNTPLGQNGLVLDFRGLLGTDSYSGYTQGTYYFADWVDLTLGGRYQIEKRYLTKSETDLDDGGSTPRVINFALQSATSYTFSPKAVLSLHPRENALVYISFGRAFKSGTYNIVNIYTPPNYIPPERITTYELGAKLDFFHSLLRVNGALFDNQLKDLQSGFVSLLSGGAVQFVTVPAARSRGAEFDATVVPLPNLDDGLALTANGAYVDAIYTDFPSGPGFNPNTGVYQSDADFTGKRIVRTPKFSGGISASQEFDSEHGTYEFTVDDYYNSGFFYDAYNNVREHPYAILNARASYRYTPWKLRITGFAQNLLDRRYHFIQFQSDFGIAKTLAPPREYGVRLNFDF